MRHIGIKAQIPIGHDYRQALFGGIAFNASTPHPGGMVVAAAMQQIQYRIAFGALALHADLAGRRLRQKDVHTHTLTQYI